MRPCPNPTMRQTLHADHESPQSQFAKATHVSAPKELGPMPISFHERLAKLCEHIEPALRDLDRVETRLAIDLIARNSDEDAITVGVPLFVLRGIANVMRATHQELTIAIEATRPGEGDAPGDSPSNM